MSSDDSITFRELFTPMALSLASLSLLIGCGAGDVTAPLARPPELSGEYRSKCSATKPQSEPLIVEWPMADRAKLEALTHRTVVTVHRDGCEVQVLGQCSVHAGYKYTPITRKRGHVAIRNADDLFANLPVGAANLEGTLQRTGALDVDMMLVGRWESDHLSVDRTQLEGDCGEATHMVTAVEVGAFVFTSGAQAAASASAKMLSAGAEGHSSNSTDTLAADGDPAACSSSTLNDANPPYGCGALIRVELTPIAPGVNAAATPSPAAGAAAGAHPATSAPAAPPANPATTACPTGQFYDSFRGCVKSSWTH